MIFASPIYLYLLLLIVPYIIWYVLAHSTFQPKMQVSSTEAYRGLHRTWRTYLVHVPFLLRIVCFAAVVLALARPQEQDSFKSVNVEGIDVMLCMDVSTSMLAEDLEPNRVKAAREVATKFVSGRPDDNIGLTVFAGEAFTLCPLTVNHSSLINLLHNLQCDMTERGVIEDGTAIGMGLASAISRLKDSKAKSKVIILLTDGSNNRGDITPLKAAEIAQTYGIRIYTIGVGTNGLANYPVRVAGVTQYLQVPVEIDSETLRSIAEKTNGQFYRAQNTQALYDVYKEIDQLERTKFSTQKFTRHEEGFAPFVAFALLVLGLELLLRTTLLKRIP